MFEQYDTLKALKEPDLHLIKDCATGTLAVRKCTKLELLPIYQQLSNISANGIPKIYALEEEFGQLIVIREYIEGNTLAEALQKGTAFTGKEATRLLVSLCDILTSVHTLTPPIIHRDIKPSNIILREDGGVCLIDFDAARQFKGGSKDTEHIGTHGYAAPEQYGFGETDARADIYAAGILLKELLGENVPANLKEIIFNCTRMDPAHRYQSATALKKALFAKKFPINKAIIVAAALVCASAVFLLSHTSTAVDNSEIPVHEMSVPTASPVETTAPPTPTPEPTPVPTPTPWLDIVWPSSNPYRYDYPVHGYDELKEALNYILENPNQLYMLIISGDITATEDITIPTNTKLYIDPVSALRMAPGTTLVNNGSIQIARGGNNRGILQLMDDSTLYCMSRKTEGYREITVDGILDCGNNVTITREAHIGQDGQYPLIHLAPKGILRCADENTLAVSGYRYVFLNSKAEFPLSPFVDEYGEVSSADIRITDISTVEEMKAAFEEARTIYSSFICAVDVSRSITIREDIVVPNNVSLKLFTDGITISVAEGAKFTVSEVNAQLENNTSIRVLSGGTLHYKSDHITLASGSRVYADEGGKIICDHKNVAEKIGIR